MEGQRLYLEYLRTTYVFGCRWLKSAIKTTTENNYKKIHTFVLCNEAFSGQHNIPNNYIICSTNSMIA